MILIKRVYEHKAADDGYRVLVDRLWPRGLSKDKAAIDIWLKDIAPSNELRKWFGHDPAKWDEFQKRYKNELKNKFDQVAQLKDLAKKHKKLTLLYGALDTEHNEAAVLAKVIG